MHPHVCNFDHKIGAYSQVVHVSDQVDAYGHHSAAITEVYAERDEQEAIEAITKVG